MGVLQKGNSVYPFWGAPINLITGLDPLSLQTTSEATYATMLPGISNLTNRLRYYGFYCWIVDFYFKKEKKGNSTEQYKFIRRAELMVALLMQSERSTVLQITGSFFAANLIANKSGRFYDLAEGADMNTNNSHVYWEYPSGAFGQYYYGAMRAISLMVAASNQEGDTIFNITTPNAFQRVSGKELSDAFDKNIPTHVKELFYQNIKSGKLYIKDIPTLIKHFDISNITAKSDEWLLYVKMLLDKDEPSQEIEEFHAFHRRETILELVQSAKTHRKQYDWRDLLLKAYKSKLGSASTPTSSTLQGWYTYQFNEYFQFASTTILWASLQYLYSFQKEQYLPTFVTELAKLITKKLVKDLPGLTVQSTVMDILTLLSTADSAEDIFQSIETKSTSDPITAAAQGFMLLFQLYNENKEELYQLKEIMTKNKMIREGNMVDGINAMHQHSTENIKDFISQFLLRKIIYRHHMVALRKMGNGSYSTQKFIIEEQFIKFIDTFPPRTTSPRMNALQNLLSDLNIIDAGGKLTPLHTILLEN